MTNASDARLCLLSVHAHPDDEASKGAGTVAKYAAEGIRGVLVCCTGGEEGDSLNPAVDTPEIRERLHEVRMEELQASVDAIGYQQLYMLGYRDSGMKDTDSNANPDNFANAPFDQAVERLVRIIRAERPQVIITYGDDSKFYPHPDHVRVHEISGPAFDAAGDPDRFPDAGDPWQPSKLYYRTRPGSRSAVSTRPSTSGSPPSSTSATSWSTGARRCWRTARRSIRRASGCDSRTTSCARSSRGRSSCWPARSSTRVCRTVTARTISSPGCASAPEAERSGGIMTKYLSQEWLDQARGLAAGQPERADATARIQWLVTKGPEGDVAYWWQLVDGRLVESSLGKLDDPDITLTLSYEDSVKIQQGDLDANAAFMQGRMKAAGNMGTFLQLLPITSSPEYRALQAELRQLAEY